MFFPVILSVTEEKHQLFLSFEKSALLHLNDLYNFSLRTTGKQSEAKRLLSETFLRAFGFYNKFENGGRCRTWLFRIMLNILKNSRIKADAKNLLKYVDEESSYEKIRISFQDFPDTESIFRNLSDDEIGDALALLPADYKTVIILHDIENFTYEEIADLIDYPVEIVISRINLARKMLFLRLYECSSKR